MKINPINITTFGSKQQVIKKVATGIAATAGVGLVADTFVKGISITDKAVESEFLKSNDSDINLADLYCCEECDDSGVCEDIWDC